MRAGLGIITAAVAFAALPARAQGIFDLGSEHAQRVVVTLDEKMPELAGAKGALESEMTRRLKGVLADIQGKQLQEFRACVPPNPFLGDPAGGERVCVLHLYAGGAAGPTPGKPEKSKRLEVVRVKDGNFIAIDMDAPADKPSRAELRRDQFAAEVSRWPLYWGGFGADSVKEPRGEVFELAQPYEQGRFVMDAKTMGDRMLNGAKATSVNDTDRVLSNEKMFCRLPKGYDPRHPAGLLVWIDPTSSGHPPQPFWPALDELNMICVGAADCGNNRLVSNREQMAFDGIATVSKRYHVDAKRVYVTGVSGGGRVSSMLAVCFPDVFSGSVPIVGLACYENVPRGTGGFWRSAFLKPRAEMWRLFKTHRMAPMTGQKDMNQIEMDHATDIYKRDGAQVKLYDYGDMGHELPKPDRFMEAIKWVDESWQAERARQEAEAKKALDAYTTKFGEKAPQDDAARRMLVKATEVGPWTEEAWKAAGWLGAGRVSGE